MGSPTVANSTDGHEPAEAGEAMAVSSTDRCPRDAGDAAKLSARLSPASGCANLALRISSYVHRKLQQLWCRYGFWRSLLAVVEAHPKHRILFSGISHGASLAQAAALKFQLMTAGMGLEGEVYAATWNAYKWTDRRGSELVGSTFAERLLPMVLSKQLPGHDRRWDSVPGYPPALTPVPGIMLLDVNTGAFFSVRNIGSSHLGPDFLGRMLDLHFASTAIRAVRTTMAVALAASPRCSEALRQSSWSVVMNHDSDLELLHHAEADGESDDDMTVSTDVGDEGETHV
eukprot:NODE_2274_length_964_cov_254.895490.p1 GENE.NODE_2274_length_964_cov_254.895490~~NODE_2274_length_964_cov_254.895490.p1  ORF type:complete len:287 (+),score=65.05 NODE_2274_length_964_cov_254.895490:3-863(+)